MNEDAQALVEFALVLPFILVFALAILVVAEVGVARVALEQAASEGARAGSLTNDDAAIGDAVRSSATPLDAARVRIAITPAEHEAPRSGDPRGSRLRVDLAYAIPVPLAFAGLPAITVRGAAARLIEWTP